MSSIRQWIRNLAVLALVFIGVSIFMFIFTKIFYPDTVSAFVLMGQFGTQLASALKLWPLVILAVIVYAMPRRTTRRK